MLDTNINFSAKTIIIAAAAILIISFAVILSQKKTNQANPSLLTTPVVTKSTAKPTMSPDAAPVVTPEPIKIRYISGVIKKVNKSSIIVSNVATKKEIEVGFDKTTKILIGQGAGEGAAISDLAVDWNVAVFLPEDKNSNTAETIHLVVKNPTK